MLNILWVFIGAGIGGICRYLVYSFAFFHSIRSFPIATLLVNVIGSFLIGCLYVMLLHRVELLSLHMRAFLMVGVLGGFTTFSSFSLETMVMLEHGNIVYALFNVVLNVGLCLICTWLGISLSRFIV